jgi:hypothetical protein
MASTSTSTSKAEIASGSAARKAKLLHLVAVSDHIRTIASSAERLQAAYSSFESYLDLGSTVLPPHYAPVLEEVALQIQGLADSIARKCDASKPKVVEEMPPLETVGAPIPDAQLPKLDTSRAVSISLAPGSDVPVFDVTGEVVVTSSAALPPAVAEPSAATMQSVPDVAAIDDFFDASRNESPQAVIVVGPTMSAKKAAIYHMIDGARRRYDSVAVMTCGDMATELANMNADKYFEGDGDVTLAPFSVPVLSALVAYRESIQRRFGKVAQSALVVHFEAGTSKYVLGMTGPLFERAHLAGVSVFVTAPSVGSLPNWRCPLKSVGVAFNADEGLKWSMYRAFFFAKFTHPCFFYSTYDKCVTRTRSCLFICYEGTENVKINLFRISGDVGRIDQPPIVSSSSSPPCSSSSASSSFFACPADVPK